MTDGFLFAAAPVAGPVAGAAQANQIPARIVELIVREKLAQGSHLPAQMLADRLQVSRQPVNDALSLLHEKGMLTRRPNRGYFVARALSAPASEVLQEMGLEATDVVTAAYFRIAEDRLRGQLPDTFSEQSIKQRYGLTNTQLSGVLSRIQQEGWVLKKPGYGWSFSTMLTTPDSLLQSYRLRLALEPAALLEPGYRLEPQVLEQCRAAERHLLAGGIETDSAAQLHERGVRFHESLVDASGNPFFIESIKRVNRIRRLLSYRSTQDRKRYPEHCRQHLHVLDLLEKQNNEEASAILREHLLHTLEALAKIGPLLKP